LRQRQVTLGQVPIAFVEKRFSVNVMAGFHVAALWPLPKPQTG
jgi:hypothetical protein